MATHTYRFSEFQAGLVESGKRTMTIRAPRKLSFRGDCCPSDHLRGLVRIAQEAAHVRELGETESSAGRQSLEQFRKAESVGWRRREACFSKPLVYVEALGCFSESEIPKRFNRLINRLRR